MKTKLIPDFLGNIQQIMFELCPLFKLFKRREGETAHEGYLPGVKSQFSTLYHEDMPDQFKQLIFDNSKFDQETKDFYSFIQIQQYFPGDYIVWHNDAYHITKLHLITLTTSNSDGLSVVEDGKIHKIYDKAGQYIDFPYDAPHAVEVVRDMRFSLVVGM